VSELFTWIEEGVLAAGRAPMHDRDFEAWAQSGITLVMNLQTEEDSSTLLAEQGLRGVHMPLVDFSAPSMTFVGEALEVINREVAVGGRVLVHCHAGKGRTGTVVAAWLVERGMTAGDAIAQVRELRPGSVETSEQEAAVQEYANSRLAS
jgi:atypical dual specificity phosphatase